MIEQSGTRCFTAFGMACGAASFIGSFFALRTNSQTAAYDFENIVLLVFLFGVIARQMFRPTAKTAPLETMAYTLFGLLYVAWLFNFMTKIVYVIPRTAQGATLGQFYVLYLVVVTKFADMGAYLVGSRIGRHQMMPHISPSKTWEGFIGSLVFAVAASCLLILLMPKHLAWLNFFHGTILGLSDRVRGGGGRSGRIDHQAKYRGQRFGSIIAWNRRNAGPDRQPAIYCTSCCSSTCDF